MKISKISFKNIHSLRGEHHIDFLTGPLAEGGLFAITGATGSGKSTLLDVITLALYNRIPRIDGAISKSVIDGEGGIMTRNTLDCYAEVEYIVKAKTYRSHWSIERNRNNNLNDRKQEIIDVATGDIIESGKSAVPNKNEALIGLSYDQFVKAMVLSQGEFSKLLKAPRDKRNQLLEDITGAKDYRAIGKAVFTKFKNALGACKDLDIRLNEIELLPEEEKKGLISESASITKAKASQKKELDVLKIAIETQKNILNNQTILNTNEALQKKLSADLETFKKDELRLEKHSKYAVHGGLISNFEQKEKEFKEASDELKRQETNKIEVLKDKGKLEEEAATVLGKRVETENYTAALNELRKQVVDLQKEEALASAQEKLHAYNIKQILVDVNRNADRLQFNREPGVFIEAITAVEERIKGFLKAKKIGHEAELVEKGAKANHNLALVNDLKVILTNYLAELKNKSSKEADLKTSSGLIEKYSGVLKFLEKELKLLEVEVNKLTKEEEKRKTHQSLEARRSLLEDGKECPLCGSLEHPFAIDNPIFDLKEAALKSKQELLATKRDLNTATQTNLISEQTKTKVLSEAILKIEATLQPQFLKIKKLCTSLEVGTIQSMQEVDTLGKKISGEIKIIEQVKEAFKLKNLLLNLKQTTTQWNKSLELKVEKEAERKKLYNGNDIEDKVQKLTNRWTATIENIKNVDQLIVASKARIKKISEERENFEKQLQQILKNEQIESVAYLKEFILPETTAESIRRKRNSLKIQEDRLKIEKEKAVQEISELKKLVTTKEPIADLQSKHLKLEEEFSKVGEKIGKINEQLDADEKAAKKQADLLDESKALKKEEALWKTMNGLIGDANGKRFSNFVQDLTLEQLIGYTNLRLKDLSDRYILDIPTAEESDKNDSLKVFDCHQGDARRSINTLSGGETFMVSLAMAFALSDLAAKNVKIESIFIDEGFGTLDPETLNQAITILEKMQNEGDKSIGVISHVEALKERISTQIKLEKTGSGYSTIEII